MTTWTKKAPAAPTFSQQAIPVGDFFAREWFNTGFFTGLGYAGIWTEEQEPTSLWSDSSVSSTTWAKKNKVTSNWT